MLVDILEITGLNSVFYFMRISVNFLDCALYVLEMICRAGRWPHPHSMGRRSGARVCYEGN